MKIIKILSDKVFPAVFWLCIMLAFDSPLVCFLSVISAAIHEIGHISAAALMKNGKISMPRGTVWGLKIDTGRLLSYREEIFIAAGGPIINIALFIILLPFFTSEYLSLFAFLNLLSALTNLLPMRGTDGGRIVHAILSERLCRESADRIIGHLTLAISSTLTFISLSLLMLLGEGWWIFAFFFAVMLGEILKSH